MGGAGAYLNRDATTAALATNFTAGSDAITTGDGTISDVTLDPSITLSWSGLDAAPKKADVSLSVKSDQLNADYETMYDETGLPVTGQNKTTNGSQDFSNHFGERSILGAHPGIRASDFADDEGSGPTETTMTIEVAVSITDGSTVLATGSTTTPYVVTVTNQGANLTISGSAGGEVSG
ncbi:hypothetical protein BRD15_12620 [Halobacteriales archaeon SW_6_65_15]|nr:MAG: hypothetical protein BRD15_12620 [Halobacteriales archaeon SW_6_65_15]